MVGQAALSGVRATAEVLGRRDLSEFTFVLRTARGDLALLPGQCFSVGLNGLGLNREYSIYSGAGDAYLDFLIRRVPDGAVSTALAEVSVGDEVSVNGPFGSFVLDERAVSAGVPHVFIASGTGIAPFASFARSYPSLDYVLYHGVRFEVEQYDRDAYPPGRYIPCISQGTAPQRRRRVTDALRQAPLPDGARYYLCGNRAMIVDVTRALRERGIAGSSIFMETFF